MLKRLGPLVRFVLGMAALIALLGVTGGLWWWLPAWPRAMLTPERGPCDLIQVAPNGEALVALHGKELVFWDLAHGRQLGSTAFEGHLQPRYSAVRLQLLFSPDGQSLAFGEAVSGRGTDPQLWRPASRPEPVPLSGLHGPNAIHFFTPDSRFLITGPGGGGLRRVWEVANFQERPFPVPFRTIKDAWLLRDGRIVVSPWHSEPGWLVNSWSTKLWTISPDFTAGSELLDLPRNRAVKLSPDGRLCATWQFGEEEELNLLRLYDIDTSRELGSIVHILHDMKVDFSADGTRLITNQQKLCDITVSPPRLLGGEQTKRLAFSPDGKWLRGYSCLTRPIDTLEIFDAATFTKQPMPAEISEITFGPDTNTIAGKGLVTPSSFQQWLANWLPGPARPPSYEAIQVWTFPGWQETAAFPDALSFAYFPDGRSMAVGHKDGRIELWDIPPRRPWWIDFGLPGVFVLLALLGVRLVWRSFRNRAGIPSVSGQQMPGVTG